MANRNSSGIPDTFDADLMAWLEAGRPSGEFAAAEYLDVAGRGRAAADGKSGEVDLSGGGGAVGRDYGIDARQTECVREISRGTSEKLEGRDREARPGILFRVAPSLRVPREPYGGRETDGERRHRGEKHATRRPAAEARERFAESGHLARCRPVRFLSCGFSSLRTRGAKRRRGAPRRPLRRRAR